MITSDHSLSPFSGLWYLYVSIHFVRQCDYECFASNFSDSLNLFHFLGSWAFFLTFCCTISPTVNEATFPVYSATSFEWVFLRLPGSHFPSMLLLFFHLSNASYFDPYNNGMFLHSWMNWHTFILYVDYDNGRFRSVIVSYVVRVIRPVPFIH